MGRPILHTVALAVDGSGDQVAFTSDPIWGRVQQIRYVPDGTSPLDTGWDLDIVGEVTGLEVVVGADNLGTSAFDRIIRAPTFSTALVASLYAAGGEPVEEAPYIAGERLQITIDEGGVSKLGTLYIWTE